MHRYVWGASRSCFLNGGFFPFSALSALSIPKLLLLYIRTLALPMPPIRLCLFPLLLSILTAKLQYVSQSTRLLSSQSCYGQLIASQANLAPGPPFWPSYLFFQLSQSGTPLAHLPYTANKAFKHFPFGP